ncbi:MAG: HU family DNA-binding protein [Muribaculaceae bacterium]|nr:HU family DNA-binding protein [Muribaculaceae bacterium]
MDNNTFTASLARQIGKEPAEVKAMASALTESIKEALCNLDSIAVPGFGRFEAVKREEYVDVDKTDGVTKLFPPTISVNFTAGSSLKKRLSHE